MTPELAYFLKVNVAFVLFYTFYRLFFSKDTFFGLRRVVLLAFFGMALVYPFLNIQDWMQGRERITEVVYAYANIILPETVVELEGVTETTWQQQLWAIAGYAYIGVIILLGLRFLSRIGSVVWLAFRSKKVYFRHLPVYILNKPGGPFSFFKLVFLHPESHSEKEIDEILTHENAHVNQWHSMDVMISELISIICWFNPFVWLLRREVRYNLEYLADNRVLQSGYDSRVYQYHLLELSHCRYFGTGLFNNFNILPLKNRIIMMNKKRSRNIGRAKYLLFIPLLALLMLFSNVDVLARMNQLEIPMAVEGVMPGEVLSVDIPEVIESEILVIQQDTSKVYTVVDQQPVFPDGDKAMMDFIGKNVVYPKSAQEKKKEGRVVCTFVVERDGSIVEPRILKSVDPELDVEAIRVVEMMPKWNPGMQRGKAVRVQYTLPIMFRLNKPDTPSAATIDVVESSDKIFTVVEKKPEFPGGDQELAKFIQNNQQYPVDAKEAKAEGRVVCSFVIDKEGSTTNVKVEKDVHPSLDKEAVRVIKSMPKWTPGEQKGEPVAVKYTLPIVFKLGSAEK